MTRQLWMFCLVLVLSACTRTLVVPANVILPDAHDSGSRVTFNQGSTTLASGGHEGKISLWQLPSGKRLATWQAHSDSINGIAFIANDTRMLTVGYDSYIKTWDLAGHLLSRHKSPAYITDMQIDERQQLIITGHADGAVRVWRVQDYTLVHSFNAFQTEVTAVAMNSQRPQYAASSVRGETVVFEPAHERVWREQAPGKIYDLAFSPDGKHLTASGWFRLFQWRLADRQFRVIDTEHNGIIKSLQYTASGDTIATISRQTDSAVYFVDPGTGVTRQRFFPHELCGADIHLSPDRRFLATTSDDASVRIWDLINPRPPVPY